MTSRMTKLKVRLLDWPGPQFLFAREVGVTPGRMSEYVMGRRPLPVLKAMEMAPLLNCNPADLIGWADEDDVIILDGVTA